MWRRGNPRCVVIALQSMVQPPDCAPMNPPHPATTILELRTTQVPMVVLEQHRDCADSLAASARMSRAAEARESPASLRCFGAGRLNEPARALTRKIRRTASSMRSVGSLRTAPAPKVFSYISRHYPRHQHVDAASMRPRTVLGAAGTCS